MSEEDFQDKNIFMMCKKLNENAFSMLSNEFSTRTCRESELDIWKEMPFDNIRDAHHNKNLMDEYFQTTYGNKKEEFFNKTLFVVDELDNPIATCLVWKSYGEFNTIQWLKVKKEYEGRGIGRALLTILLKNLDKKDYPIYLHTQAGSFRAIKLYSDFGFCLLTNEYIGNRKNELNESIPFLKRFIPEHDFVNISKCQAPNSFADKLKEYNTIEF